VKRKAEKKGINYYMKLKYKIEVVPIPEEDGGGYEARIPQLGKAAFIGYGETVEEALAHLEVVKRDLFESYLKDGVPIPEPEKEEGRYSGRILLRVPIYLHKELSELARKEDISLNQLLNHLIERGLAYIHYKKRFVEVSQEVIQTLNQWYKPSFEIDQKDIPRINYDLLNTKDFNNQRSIC
jgi:predicted HicB family RNase H-like nuclease